MRNILNEIVWRFIICITPLVTRSLKKRRIWGGFIPTLYDLCHIYMSKYDPTMNQRVTNYCDKRKS